MEACGLLAKFMTFRSKLDTSLLYYQLLVHSTNVAAWSTANVADLNVTDVAALSGANDIADLSVATDVADLSATDIADFRTVVVLPV